MKAAFDALPVAEQKLLQRTKSRIEVFAQAQRASIQSFSRNIPGGQAGQDVAPMQVAGCYAPGGRYPLPSSVLMTAVTARVAGVATVIVASPRPAPATLAAGYISNADMLLAVGGAQAIAALAYGIDGVPPCDIIVGPGNKWVTAAKSLVYGKCTIDMLAGPSECLVVADEAGLEHAATIAADLLAQAEHDTAAVPILVTNSLAVIEAVNKQISAQLATLPTAPTATVSVGKGFAVLCPDMNAAVDAANILAAEHVEIICKDSQAIAKRIDHYGGLFIGARAAEVLGDYGVGPNHVLPTGGTAKYTGGLSVHTFLRIRTWMRIDDAKKSQELVEDAVALARIEGLEGHARAAEQRLV
ncbi:histidinol dehydrogenase [Thraustotheca clavata]|uniref:Histidinol dehydrogenase n=1 Tax=Thraustotheca clavata TaxID=74557 RepID=A0A1V9YUT7_9STRA|nr:histidinol dehydrogenase [Thraustotheca clavata]